MSRRTASSVIVIRSGDRLVRGEVSHAGHGVQLEKEIAMKTVFALVPVTIGLLVFWIALVLIGGALDSSVVMLP